MADIITSYAKADTYGRAAFEQMDNYVPATLLAGHEPGLEPANTYAAKARTTLPQFAVVGREGNAKDGAIVLATATTVQAIGVLAHGFTAGATGVTPASVFEIGVFNVGSDSPLVWDTSFDTEAKKLAAFRGAPSPTRIIARRHLTPAA